MKISLVVFAALCAVAYAQNGDDHSVRVVEQPGKAPVIQNPDPAFYQPSNGPNIVPDRPFYQPSNGNGGAGNINILPDPFFHNPQSGGGVQPSFGPTFTSDSPPPYPYKPRDNPYARGGK